MTIKARQLKFPLERKIFGHEKFPNIFYRVAARKVTAFLINRDVSSYQFFDHNKQELFQGSKFDMAHWILRSAGYVCCVADLMKLAGKKLEDEFKMDDEGKHFMKVDH